MVDSKNLNFKTLLNLGANNLSVSALVHFSGTSSPPWNVYVLTKATH